MLYGAAGLNCPADKNNLSTQPGDCYYQEGGKGNTQAWHFYIQLTFP
jgi:hypothetical protein